MEKICKKEGCIKLAKSGGFCHNHYMQEYRKKNIEQFRLRDKQFYEKNKEKILFKQSEYNKNNSEIIKEKKKKQYRDNPEPAKQRSAKWAKDNRERHNQRNAEWTKAHPDIVNAKSKRYYEKYPEKSNARHAKYKSKKLQAIPKWFNEFDEFVINEAHKLARQRTKITGIKWHVDHIVPLQSKLVCGLHCASNMQVIPAFTNIQKLNRYWPDMPD